MSPLLTRLALFLGLTAAAMAADRTRFDHSILTVPAATDVAHPRRGHVVRAALKAAEQSAAVHFEVALKMRNFAELQERVARGEQISRTEMAAKYFPLAADETRIADWLRAQGLKVDRVDDNHLAIFGSGPASVVATALDTTFARVANAEGEFTSAVTAPSLPADFASVVAGVHGLQPHLRPRPLMRSPSLTPAATATYLPAQIMTAYSAAGLGLTGSGQTIAIFSGGYPASSDLTAFWTRASSSASLNNITQVNIESGPSSPSQEALEEVSLDVEWASAIAPGAKIRIYGASEDNLAGFDLAFQQVYADLPANPSLHIFSISFGGNEQEIDQDYLVIESQYMANLASAGVTVFASSGDEASNPNNTVQVEYPACDPNVTGVGGTSMMLDNNNAITSERAWSDSGGGTSSFYARPSWQNGTGVTTGSFRLVPDVAGPADPNYGALVIVGGVSQPVGGTSWAAPMWAGFAAMINQSRVASGAGVLGALNPQLYPQLGTSAFHDIVSGSNGSYSATTGYDRVTGLGSPNVAALLQSGLSGTPPLAIASQLPAVFTIAGQPATFYIVASGTGSFTFQWQRLPVGTSTWVSLSDDGNYVGTATAMLVINAPTYGMNGDSYRCILSNASSAITGAATTLTVSPVGVTTLAGWPGSAGRTDGTGFAARFDFVGAGALDANGNLYIADGGNTLRYVTAAGVVTTVAGQPGVAGWQDGTKTGALFNGPAGVALDPSGNIYVADFMDCTIRKVTPSGVVTTFAGKGNVGGATNGTGTNATFTAPSALSSDSAGTLYLADGTGNTIRKITTPGAVVTTLAGTGTTGQTNGAAANATFSDPQGVAVDSAGNVYVGDTGNNCIRLISASTGQVTTFAGSTTGRAGSTDGIGTNARFNGPAGLKVDASGNVYVCDSFNGTIRMITPQGVVTTISGRLGALASKDGVNSAASFTEPGDLVLGPSGVIYVMDSLNYSIRRVVPGTATAPQLTAQPSSLAVSTGQTATFTVAVSSTATTPLAYQWQIEAVGSTTWSALADGSPYSGSTTAILTINPATVSLSGAQYRCVVTNPAGSVTSNSATLTVQGPPLVASSNQSTAVAVGGSVTLAANATGTGLSYQWYLNGTAVVGATGSTLTITNFAAANAGTYTVKVTNSFGSTTATIAVLSVSGGRLINLSALAAVSPGNPLLTVGFILGGGSTKTLLLRGIGPSLAAFNYSSPLADPQLKLFNGSSVQQGYNAGWGTTAGGTAALSAAFMLTFAFPLNANSADDAILIGGLDATGRTGYSVQESSLSGGSGAVLNEIYEADTVSTTARLLNLSAIGAVSPGTNLIAGFTIGGTGSETVLIRGVGPTLGNLSITNYLAHPVLTVYRSSDSAVLSTNTAWGLNASTTAAQLSATFTLVNAFPLITGSSDTAVLLTLPAGSYSAQVTSTDGTSGQALIEIYEVNQ